jgi:NADH-quinone oxidoreductase subunit E
VDKERKDTHVEDIKSGTKRKNSPAELYGKLDAYIESLGIQERPSKKRVLIQSLHKASGDFSAIFLKKLQIHVANNAVHSPCRSFRCNAFIILIITTKPKCKYRINVCHGNRMLRKGAETVLQEFERVLGIKSGKSPKI